MATLSWISRRPLLAVACIFACANSYAQTSVLNQVNTVAAATQAVPVQETFTVSATGSYTVTLTDLGALLTPSAPLASVALAITNGSAIVGTPLTAPGTAQFNATAGVNYTIQVVGLPGTVAGSGPIGIQVTGSGSSPAAAFSDTLALPSTSTATSSVGVLNSSFTVTTSGNYQVTLSDLQLPQALTTLTMAIAVPGGALVTNSTLATTPGSPTVTATVALQSGVTYDIFAGGQGSTTTNAGLYGVSVTPLGGGTPVYGNTIPVGAVTSVSSSALTAGNYTFSIADLAYPAALASLGAAVTLNGQAVAELTASGNQPFTATAGTYQVFAFGLTSGSTQGSYAVTLAPTGGAPVVSVARAVTAPGGPAYAYSYDATVDGESYTLSVTDFAFPAPFTTLSVEAVQNGAILGSALTAAALHESISPVTGTVTLLVFAQGGLGGSLLDLNLANSGGTLVLDETQGVGASFTTTPVAIPSTGAYQFTLLDLSWPAQFTTLAGIVTQGGSNIGQIVGGGAINSTQLNEGTYYLSILATPAATGNQAGTYALSVNSAPPAPGVTFAASASSVASGGTVNLTWTTTGATSCVGSGGSWTATFAGALATTDSVASPALTSTQTFTLTCSGAGGTTAKSVTVSVTAASGSHGGGGGSLDLWTLLGLVGGLSLRRSRV
jgi:hypothetical protein